jgi:hypothetical protein
MTTLQAAVDYLMQNGYMVKLKGGYKVTAKFNKEMTGKAVGVQMVGDRALVVEKASDLPVLAAGKNDWAQLFLQFIKDAEVPARSEGRTGSTYEVNKYSEEGKKAFQKAIEKEGVNYQALVKSTMLYYKTHKKFALKIGNYFSDGAWRSDYDALITSAREGKIEEHIKTSINADREFSRYRIG